MSDDNLIGSRYELNISQQGCEDTLRAKSYQDIYECDLPQPVTDPAEEVTGYNVEKVADICAGLKTLERVEFLRFHQMGMDKWRKLGIPYPLADTEPRAYGPLREVDGNRFKGDLSATQSQPEGWPRSRAARRLSDGRGRARRGISQDER